MIKPQKELLPRFYCRHRDIVHSFRKDTDSLDAWGNTCMARLVIVARVDESSSLAIFSRDHNEGLLH